jgi:hypothetical protein
VTPPATGDSIAVLPKGRRKHGLQAAAMRMFEEFHGRCLAFDDPAASRYAALVSTRMRAGRPIGVEDAQIAAMALAGGFVLATRNVRDFADSDGLSVVDPFTPCRLSGLTSWATLRFQDEGTSAAVIRNLEIIGETARRLPDAYRSTATEVPGLKIIGLRNRMVLGQASPRAAVRRRRTRPRRRLRQRQPKVGYGAHSLESSLSHWRPGALMDMVTHT